MNRLLHGLTMHGLTCDLCGENLLVDSDVRYRVTMEVFAAYDPLEVTRGDLARDIEAEMAALLKRIESMHPRELQDQVHRRFEFDLCPECQRLFLNDPLGLGRPRLKPPPAGDDAIDRSDATDGGER